MGCSEDVLRFPEKESGGIVNVSFTEDASKSLSLQVSKLKAELSDPQR